MGSDVVSGIIFALDHCLVLFVRYNDFSGFHVGELFPFKIISLLREVWSACHKHALQQSVLVLCP